MSSSELIRLAYKFAAKYSLGASRSFNILGLTPKLKDLDMLAKSKYIDERDAAAIAQNRFNQLVAPYLKMKPVNLSFIGDFEFFLHDLIHEAMKEGSQARFIETDKQKRTPTQYSLQDYIDEDIAEYLSSNPRLEGGFYVYLENLLERLPRPINNVRDFANRLNELMSKDIKTIKNTAQQKLLNLLKKKILFTINSNSQIVSGIENNEYDFIASILQSEIKNVFSKGIENSSLIDDELIASLIRRWLMAVQKDFEARSILLEDYKNEFYY